MIKMLKLLEFYNRNTKEKTEGCIEPDKSCRKVPACNLGGWGIGTQDNGLLGITGVSQDGPEPINCASQGGGNWSSSAGDVGHSSWVQWGILHVS